MILSRLGNTVTNNDRRKIKTELYETEKKKNLSDKEKEKIYDNFVKIVKTRFRLLRDKRQKIYLIMMIR